MIRVVLTDEQWERVAPFLPGKATDPGESDIALVRRIARQVYPYWRQIAGIFALNLLATPLALLLPLPLKLIVDSVLGSRPLPGFLSAVYSCSERSVE